MPRRRGIYVGLGANLDDPVAQLEAALAALDARRDTRVVRRSRLYRTPAWGPVPQDDFVNAVAELETSLGPAALLEALLGIERDLGRDRSVARYGPRRIDLDVLVHGDEVRGEAGLTVPHPRIAERAFVLVPLVELAPDLEIPGLGRADALLARLDPAERARITVLEADGTRGE